MNFGKILDYIADNNINPDEIFALVEKVKNSDLKNEKVIRDIIKEVSRVAKKEVDPLKEDMLVKKILKDGVSEDLLDII